MTLYNVNELIAFIVIFAIGLGLLIGGIYLYEKSYYKYSDITSFIGGAMGFIGGIGGGIALICAIFMICGSAIQRNDEPINYQTNLELHRSIQASIDNSKDIVNTNLYLRAIEFNTDLAQVQAAQEDPRYSMSFSGEVDWSTIPFINLG